MKTLVLFLDLNGYDFYKGSSFLQVAEKNHFDTLISDITPELISKIVAEYDNVVIPGTNTAHIPKIDMIYATKKNVVVMTTLKSGPLFINELQKANPNVSVVLTVKTQSEMTAFYGKPIHEIVEDINATNVLSLSYEFSLQNFNYIGGDLMLYKSLGKPIVIRYVFNKDDADFVESLNDTQKQILKTRLEENFPMDRLVRKDAPSFIEDTFFYGPGTISYRRNMQNCDKDCSNCYCLQDTKENCYECFAYTEDGKFSPEAKAAYIADIERIKTALGL